MKGDTFSILQTLASLKSSRARSRRRFLWIPHGGQMFRLRNATTELSGGNFIVWRLDKEGEGGEDLIRVEVVRLRVILVIFIVEI
jgi:hypothetical protein